MLAEVWPIITGEADLFATAGPGWRLCSPKWSGWPAGSWTSNPEDDAMSPEERERLAAIRRRLARATPRPWRALPSGRIVDAEGIPVAQTPITTELAEPTRQDLANADLIAHVDDLEWLVELVERLDSEDPHCA